MERDNPAPGKIICVSICCTGTVVVLSASEHWTFLLGQLVLFILGAVGLVIALALHGVL